MSASRVRPRGLPTTASSGRRVAAFGVALATAGIVSAVAGTTALATWSLPGTGTTTAAAGTLAAPTGVSGSSVPGSGAVTVSWTAVAAPDGGVVDGYVVERLQGATASPACGSSASSPLPPAPTSCSDAVSVAGTYVYRVTARFRTWSATSAASGNVSVVLDVTPPTAVSITRAGTSPTASATVAWTVTFRRGRHRRRRR